MKNLTQDTEGLLPVIIGVAIAGLLGYSWLTDATADTWEFMKVIIVASLLFVFGLIALMGKFIAMPKPLGFLVGLGCIIGSIYLVYLGRFPI